MIQAQNRTHQQGQGQGFLTKGTWGAGCSEAVTVTAQVAEPAPTASLSDLTFVEHVARSGSISRSSLCRTALGQSVESRASMMKVSI